MRRRRGLGALQALGVGVLRCGATQHLEIQHGRRLVHRQVLQRVLDGLRTLRIAAQLVGPVVLHGLQVKAGIEAQESLAVGDGQLGEDAVNPGGGQ